ncbi:MAG TPA: TM0106 family RecB-like putative nuclease [Gaiellaceae bacterium]
MKLIDAQIMLSPSDLSDFLACEHLTSLELRGTPGREVVDPQVELIQRKGEEHERGYLDQLGAVGRDVVEIPDGSWDERVALTQQALRDGADVVYQGVFTGGRWRGIADFLMRVDTPSELGPWSYEALDTKLARHAKPSYILQLCFYNEQVARIQGREPANIHVLLGNSEQQSFRPQDFGAYYRRVRSRLERFVDDPLPTEAWPCEHCGVCNFKPVCDAHWDAIDHLSRVAGISSTQIAKLAPAGITTLAGLGLAPAVPAPAGIGADTWTRIHEQAALQFAARANRQDSWVILPSQRGAGLALLPEPSDGDLFFDFEGNPFWDSDGSLEYLWGILDVDRNFRPLHAHDHETERIAFETFIDYVHERLRAYSDLHVYHYAQYEITALKRLMGRYGTREAELDDLLRREVFVDLYKVVRGGVRTSRPGYGLKELESFLPDFERRAEVKDGGTSIVVFEQWMQTRDDALLAQIDDYNEEDCLATLLLRDWLLGLRAAAIAQYGELPPPPEPAEPKPIPEKRAERAELRQRLLDAGHELAAQLLGYHDRERKPVWWAFFDRIEPDHDHVEDSESIGGLELVGPPEQVTKQSKAYTFTFPAQELKIGQGQDTFDPATQQSPGEILELDKEARRIVLKRGPKVDARALPKAIIPGNPYRTDDQEDALVRLGESLLSGGGKYPALEAILRREPFDRDVQTSDLDAMKELVLSLDGQHLVIQGPPGSGKTWTSGRLIAHLMQHGKTVGVASTSHKAIHNLVASVEEGAAEIGLDFKGIKKASAGNPESFYDGDVVENTTDGAACVDRDLAAGTAWLFSRGDHDGRWDYLFVDEAGQVSLADALAMGACARNVVLVGDPQQLDQVLQGTHPSGSGASVLKHLIGDDETIAPNRGLFLEHTYRMHPDICGYISEEFYEGRLTPDASTAQRTTPLGTGLRFIAVEHDGCRQESPEEVAAVVAQVAELRAAGVAGSQIMVVSPYNAQVNALAAVLPEDVRVGTVDRFQGQEADVVVYSMASSSGEDVPRGLQFLLSRNRLNVAISRARCLAYLVASPKLLEVNCNTIPEMRLANALCRFVELAA